MNDIYEEIVYLRNLGETCALATVAQVKGSTPQAAGAKMLVRQDGSIMGSIGGGCLEAKVWEEAQKVINQETPMLVDFDLTGRVDTKEGLICGGIMQILIEPVLPTPVVHILGAGHIGFAVSKIAKIAGFGVVVVDERPAFANAERFPDADRILVEDPAGSIPSLNINKAAYIVIACRGHLEDQEALVAALKTPARYIGMLGSHKKVKTVFANLVQQGVSEEALNKVHSPIGIRIATDTPEDIAISIMAEIVDIRRQYKKKAWSVGIKTEVD